jgi:transposase-like protein
MQSISTVPESSSPSTIIRTGSDGRLRFTRDQRQALLDAYDSSGLSAMAFARGHGVHYQTFVAWLRKRREQACPPDASSPAFAEVLFTSPEPGTTTAHALRILLPCGAVIEVGSCAALPLAVELLTALRRSC